MKKCNVWLALALALIVKTGGATNYYVVASGSTPTPPWTNWAGAHTNLIEVIARCRDNDTVYLTNNATYYLTNQAVIGYAVTVRSWAPDGGLDPATTILNGNYPNTTNRCFTVNHDRAWLAGLTIARFIVDNHGGGVYLQRGNMTNCHVTQNSTLGGTIFRGGGIYMDTTWTGLVTHCQISYNTNLHQYGGGLGIDGPGTIRNCEIHNNSAPNGGTAFMNKGIIDQCVIRDNNDGIRSSTDAGSNTVIRNSLFMNTGNSYAFVMGPNPFSIINCTLISNTLYIVGDAVTNRQVIVNCIVSNSGAMTRLTPVVTNWFYNCCIADSALPVSQGNITASPKYVNPAGNDWRLSRESPCVNAGLDQAMIGVTDLDGRKRIDRFGGRVDMGAYEYLPSGMMFMFH